MRGSDVSNENNMRDIDARNDVESSHANKIEKRRRMPTWMEGFVSCGRLSEEEENA